MRTFVKGYASCAWPLCPGCMRTEGGGRWKGEHWPVLQISSVVNSLDDFTASLWSAFIVPPGKPEDQKSSLATPRSSSWGYRLGVRTWTQDSMSPKFAVMAPGSQPGACWDSRQYSVGLLKAKGKVWVISQSLAPTITSSMGHSDTGYISYLWKDKVFLNHFRVS